MLPQHAAWVKSLPPRIVDLLEPFRKFHCYHPAQHGSASIKAVLPAFTGKDYSGLAIGEGGTAMPEQCGASLTFCGEVVSGAGKGEIVVVDGVLIKSAVH